LVLRKGVVKIVSVQSVLWRGRSKNNGGEVREVWHTVNPVVEKNCKFVVQWLELKFAASLTRSKCNR
jgi:hypothetical protein